MTEPSDDLRTRIAAVLKLKYLANEDLHNHAADAVIRELGLRQEWLVAHESGGGSLCASREKAQREFDAFVERPPGVDDPGSGKLTGIESRYVTEWELE